jgi:hypothetical protein
MILDRRGFLRLAAGIPMALAAAVEADEVATREVILCFDGSGPAEKWGRLHELSDRLAELTGSAHFTVFACGAQLLTQMPGSTIGAGGTPEEIEERLQLMQAAIDKGHEIGNHTVRHKNGRAWSYQQWFDELAEFDQYMARFFRARDGSPYKPLGFRAPYLKFNDPMYRALEKLGYVYDVSQVGDFTKMVGGIVAKGMPMCVRDNGQKILAMDYNWHLGKITDVELDRMLSRCALLVNGEPVVISLHFTDYGYGKRDYFQTVADFMIALAKKGGYRFVSMIEHIRTTVTLPGDAVAEKSKTIS